MEHQEIVASFEASSDQVVQLLHHGTSLSEAHQIQIKQTIEVLRLTYDEWTKMASREKPSEPVQKPIQSVSSPPLATQ